MYHPLLTPELIWVRLCVIGHAHVRMHVLFDRFSYEQLHEPVRNMCAYMCTLVLILMCRSHMCLLHCALTHIVYKHRGTVQKMVSLEHVILHLQ